MKTLFIDMIPKRVKKSIENDRTKYSHNKDILNKILKIEENDKELKEKKLSIKLIKNKIEIYKRILCLIT